MSSLIGGRSESRGRCAQPCCLPYIVYEPGDLGRRKDKHYTPEQAGQSGARSRIIEQTGKKNRNQEPAAFGRTDPSPLNESSERYVLSLKDLCTLDILPDIVEADVYSLKIEGRMKSSRYMAGAVNIYHKYMDRYLGQGRDKYFVKPENRKMLLDLFDRGGFIDGYYVRHNGRDMVALKEKPESGEGNQKPFRYLDKTYVMAEPKEKVRGHVELAEGEPSRPTLESHGGKVQAPGQMPQAVEHQPMTRERVLKRLNRMGGGPFSFETLTTQVEGDLFLPIQTPNELHHTGLQELEKRLTGVRVLTSEGSVEAQFRPVPTEAAAPQSQSVLTAFLEETAQLFPVLARGEMSVVYLNMDGSDPDQWGDIADHCHDRGGQYWLALPQVFRSHARRYLGADRHPLRQAGSDGVLIRAPEEVVWLRDLTEQKNQRMSLPSGMGASVYGWSNRSAEVLVSTGTSLLTVPWELNDRKIEPVLGACRGLGMASELATYGNAPMMVSVRYTINTVKGCTHKRGTLMMKDRIGALLSVKNHCSLCYNTIYSPTPLSLLGSEKLIGRLAPDHLHLQFTVEGIEQTEKVLDVFIGSFVYGRDVEAPFRDFIGGHLKCGME